MPETIDSFEAAAAFLREHAECEAATESHLRLRIPVAGAAGEADSLQPVTVYHGRSTTGAARERIHIASPLLGVDMAKALDAAALMDTMPLGGIRLLGEYLHVHDSLTLPEIGTHILEATVRLVAAEAAALVREVGAGAGESVVPTGGQEGEE